MNANTTNQDALKPAGRVSEEPTIFQDLRRRNERRLKLAPFLDSRRQRQVERVMQVARQRRFRQSG